MRTAQKEGLISINEFLSPWVERASLLTESLGAPQECVKSNPSGQLAKCALSVLAAVQKEILSPAEKDHLLHQADWMIDTLSGIRCSAEQASGLGAAHLPELFWGLPAGRILITLYSKVLGQNLTTPIQAARMLDIDAQSVYRMMYTSRLPSYPDLLSTTSRKSHRIRMDHLRRLLAEDNVNIN